MKLKREHFDLIVVAVIVLAFLLVASRSLGYVPVPDTDESMTLQVTYEMLFRGKLAFPMYRFLGGNIENVWHSYTPVYFLLLGGFQKIFGWGVASGRAFNLLTAAMVLLLTHLIGRRLFDWRAGLIAVLALVSDPVLLERARLVRGDYAGAMFALLAFYLYETAERTKRVWLFAFAGLSAGAAVMCHTNLLYIVGVIGLLLLLTHGRRILRTKGAYFFFAGAAATMAYEVIYDGIDYRNFVLQNRDDRLHFRVLSPEGWWINLSTEWQRYADWYRGFETQYAGSLLLLHLFQWLAAVSIIYLAGWLILSIRRGQPMKEPRVRLLVATLAMALFFAIVVQRKIMQYVVHLAPWFALCVGVLGRDVIDRLRSVGRAGSIRLKPAITLAAISMFVVAGALCVQLVRQDYGFIRRVSDPEQASFEEIKQVLRSVVPDELCPVSIGSGVLWLAFPERDQCYAVIERRMKDAVDIKGANYALIVRPKGAQKMRSLIRPLVGDAPMIAELKGTAYGNIRIYYTGTDPRWISEPTKRYRFFGNRPGFEIESE
jgi:4-amino-4-deoxy-L-arabinose transferase-like glycosyltransferase